MTLAFANGDFQNQGKDQANGPNAPVRTTARSGALMGNPLVLLLDEPSEGLAPIVVATIAKVLRELGASGATILLAKQNMHSACGLPRKPSSSTRDRWCVARIRPASSEMRISAGVISRCSGHRAPLQANAIASRPEQSSTRLAAVTARNPPDTRS
jgi:hypothetical protein